MRILFAFNPNSGKAQIKNQLLNILKIFSYEDNEVVVYPSKATKDIYEYVKRSEGRFDLIACSGGDGTLNETVAAVMEYQGEKPPIGYIPSGTTNDYARSLRIPQNMAKAAWNIIGGVPEKVDVGVFNGRYYNYVAAFGAFTEVSYATPQQFKNLLGHQAYVLEGVRSIPNIKPFHMKIETPEVSIEGDYIYGMITNTKSVGGFKNLTGKHVQLNDGLFECTFVKKPADAFDPSELWDSLVKREGNILKNAMLEHFRASMLDIHADIPLAWVLDGEFGGDVSDVHIEVRKQAVKIMIPDALPNWI